MELLMHKNVYSLVDSGKTHTYTQKDTRQCQGACAKCLGLNNKLNGHPFMELIVYGRDDEASLCGTCA